MAKIFGSGAPGGAHYAEIAVDKDDKNVERLAFIVLSSSGGVAATDEVFNTTAPMQEVKIQQLADYSITKSLDSDFMVSAFGDTPVQISIGGLHILRMSGAQNMPISKWYAKNKISASKRNRVKVAISMSGATVVYNCIVTGLLLEGYKESVVNGIVPYTLTLVGVVSQ